MNTSIQDSKTGKHANTDRAPIALKELTVSKWNRNYGMQLDEAYVKALAADISKDGLRHPLTLVARGTAFTVVSGANRLAALKTIRGAEGQLNVGEYDLRANISENDQECLCLSVNENKHRQELSPYQTARYIERLLEEMNVEQKALMAILGLDEPTISRLKKLVACFELLPDPWQIGLDAHGNPCRLMFVDDDDDISLSHWNAAAPLFQEDGASGGKYTCEDDVPALLERCSEQGWSTRQLQAAIKAYRESRNGSATQAAEGQAKPTSVTLRVVINDGNRALKKVKSISAVLAPREEFQDIRKEVDNIAEKIEQRISALQAEQKAAIEKTRKSKSANAKAA